jgi:hypothetical protein
MIKREWEWAAGHFDMSAFLRVRALLLTLADGENPVTGKETELIVLPAGWPIKGPPGPVHRVQGPYPADHRPGHRCRDVRLGPGDSDRNRGTNQDHPRGR